MKEHAEQLSAEEERWLDQLLAGQPGASGEHVEGKDFLAAAKAELQLVSAADWSLVREGALVGRVLAATTREDLSWRGELRLVAGYVRERLRSSVLLRVVAASLVLHLAAVPVVAYWVGSQAPKQSLFFDVELPPVDEFEEPLADELPAEVGDRPHMGSPAPAAIDNAIRRARFVLSKVRGPEWPGALAADSLERKLMLGRSAFLQDRSWQPWWNQTEYWSSASPLARVLWVELLLDAFVLEDRRSSELGLYLAELALHHGADAAAGEPLSATAQLRSNVLERAQAYGLRSSAAGFDPSRLSEPLSQNWLETLRSAAASNDLPELLELLDDPAFVGWTWR